MYPESRSACTREVPQLPRSRTATRVSNLPTHRISALAMLARARAREPTRAPPWMNSRRRLERDACVVYIRGHACLRSRRGRSHRAHQRIAWWRTVNARTADHPPLFRYCANHVLLEGLLHSIISGAYFPFDISARVIAGASVSKVKWRRQDYTPNLATENPNDTKSMPEICSRVSDR